jgi:acetolactate synthase-1/2/3 large subunit
MLGADILVEALHREGVTHVFGLPGTTIMSVLDALARREDMRYISTRHEQVAGFMADGYARASGLPSVALASRGPGAANMAIAVHNAHAESIPLLAVVGQVPDDIMHRDSFEETDLVAQFTPITKWAVEVHDPARIPELVQRAVRVASSGRPGPVLVSVPMDAQTRDAEPAFQPYFRPAPPAPDPAALHRAAALLRSAHRPVIITGGGMLSGGYHSGLHELATRLPAPVVTTWLRKNAVANDADYFCGSLGYGAPAITENLVREADVVLALGCRFSEFTTKRYTLLSPTSQLVHVDIDAGELGHIYLPEIGLHADAGSTATALAALLSADAGEAAAARGTRLSELRRAYLAATQPPPLEPGSSPVPSAAIVAALRPLARREDIVLAQDVHTFGPWIQRFVEFIHPGSYYAAAGGSMGWGFPAALGIALARPDKRVVAVHGDGSFFMVAQDLETAVRENIPVVNVIVNNFAYGNTRDRQRFAFDQRYLGVFLGNPDFARYAELLGAYGERVDKPEQLGPALDRALASGRPAVLDVIQDSFEGLPDDLRPPGTR